VSSGGCFRLVENRSKQNCARVVEAQRGLIITHRAGLGVEVFEADAWFEELFSVKDSLAHLCSAWLSASRADWAQALDQTIDPSASTAMTAIRFSIVSSID